MSVKFKDPICQHPGCPNPTAAYVNATMSLAASASPRMEARCVEHGAWPFSAILAAGA